MDEETRKTRFGMFPNIGKGLSVFPKKTARGQESATQGQENTQEDQGTFLSKKPQFSFFGQNRHFWLKPAPPVAFDLTDTVRRGSKDIQRAKTHPNQKEAEQEPSHQINAPNRPQGGQASVIDPKNGQAGPQRSPETPQIPKILKRQKKL